MSLLRPRWLEDLLPPTPAGTPRLRNLKGFAPTDVAAFQDPFTADDPTHWLLSGVSVAAPALFSIVGVQVPTDDALLVSVDGVIVTISVADTIVVQVGSAAYATDTSVIRLNRRESSRGPVFDRCGLSRIIDNTTAIAGTQIGVVTVTANTPVYIPLRYRLFGVPGAAPEQLSVRGAVNETITAMMWGRLTVKGPR